MKFDPLVKSQNNKLYRLSDGAELDAKKIVAVSIDDAVSGKAALPADKDSVVALTLNWNQIEMAPESYNEEILAALREYLKNLEEKGFFAFILPSAGKAFDDADAADSFIKCMVHTARRIKDAQSVIGFALASELLQKDAGSDLGETSWTKWFVNEMNVKHGHYVYFASSSEIQKNGLDAVISKTDYILY